MRTLGLLRYTTGENHRAELPVVVLRPVDREKNGDFVVWVSHRGKSGLFTDDGKVRPGFKPLFAAGRTVIGVDLFMQGEFLKDESTEVKNRALPGEEAHCGWTYCYNQPIFARRAQDVLAAISLAKKLGGENARVSLVGFDAGGHWAAAAAALAGDRLDRVALDTGGFRFAAVQDVHHADFQPGAARYGGFPALLALASPAPLWVAGEDADKLVLVRAAYEAADKSNNLRVYEGNRSRSVRTGLKWLVE